MRRPRKPWSTPSAAELTPEALNAAKIAASLMAMNNIYYRFVHLVHAADYKTLPAKLRMTAMAKPGVDKVDFELWSLVVSAINGCGMCLEAHEKVCREHGLSAEQIQAAVRIAATVHAVARTLSAEEALATPLAKRRSGARSCSVTTCGPNSGPFLVPEDPHVDDHHPKQARRITPSLPRAC